jgi:hypothetical protein
MKKKSPVLKIFHFLKGFALANIFIRKKEKWLGAFHDSDTVIWN